MKKLIVILSVLCASLPLVAQAATEQESLNEMIERGLRVARQQSLVMAQSLEGQQGSLPRTFQDGKLVCSDYSWWCSGFFPGVLWLLYDDSGDAELGRYAKLFTDRVEPAKEMRSTHDLGFMLYCSFGQGYALTHDKHYLDVIEEGTESLLTRYNERLGVIQSWESSNKWKYPVIIDNMMNLEMLCFVSRATGNKHYVRVAKRHADTTIKNHFRKDYSTYHVVSYDPETGKPHARQTHQGYADYSAWARGQAWGLYGYTMMYRETGKRRYLKQARHIAHFIASHLRLPEDGIPYWDFDAPETKKAGGVLRDASAGAVMASALIELSQLDHSSDAPKWLALAEKQLRTLTTDAYMARECEQGGFVLKHSVGSLPGKSEVDVPLTYADYYYVEALLRLKHLNPL